MRILLLTTALLTTLAAPVQAAPGTTHVVEVVGSQFKPEKIVIKRYDRIRWVFRGPGTQSVRRGLDWSKPCKPAGGPNSGPKRAGQSYTYRFDQTGDYPIFDEVNNGCRKGIIARVGVSGEE